MTPGARIEAAIELLDEIRGGTRPADQVIDAYFKRCRYAGSGDRRAISERVYNLLRRRARIDWWIDRTGIDGAPDTRRRLIADLALSDKSSPEQTADLFSGARHCPATLTAAETDLADALYGRPLTHGEMPGPVRYEYPDWMEPSLSALWGNRLEMEISALNQRATVDLRVNTLKATPEAAEAALASEFIEAQPTPLSPIGLRLTGTPRLGGTQAFKTGLVEIQDEGSQIVSLLTGAEPGMTAVDFCAGAGGKTLALAASMGIGSKVRGRLVACDVSDIRMEHMQPRLKRAGARQVECRQLRAKDDPWIADNHGTADRVLADVPCTGTGAWRRDPEAKWRYTPTDLDEIKVTQRRILSDAARLVKTNGRMVYATCSLLQEENEQQLAWFLDAHTEFQVLPIDRVWAETVGGPPPPTGPCLRLSPGSTGTDGFFCAVLERLAT